MTCVSQSGTHMHTVPTGTALHQSARESLDEVHSDALTAPAESESNAQTDSCAVQCLQTSVGSVSVPRLPHIKSAAELEWTLITFTT